MSTTGGNRGPSAHGYAKIMETIQELQGKAAQNEINITKVRESNDETIKQLATLREVVHSAYEQPGPSEISKKCKTRRHRHAILDASGEEEIISESGVDMVNDPSDEAIQAQKSQGPAMSRHRKINLSKNSQKTKTQAQAAKQSRGPKDRDTIDDDELEAEPADLGVRFRGPQTRSKTTLLKASENSEPPHKRTRSGNNAARRINYRDSTTSPEFDKSQPVTQATGKDASEPQNGKVSSSDEDAPLALQKQQKGRVSQKIISSNGIQKDAAIEFAEKVERYRIHNSLKDPNYNLNQISHPAIDEKARNGSYIDGEDMAKIYENRPYIFLSKEDFPLSKENKEILLEVIEMVKEYSSSVAFFLLRLTPEGYYLVSESSESGRNQLLQWFDIYANKQHVSAKGVNFMLMGMVKNNMGDSLASAAQRKRGYETLSKVNDSTTLERSVLNTDGRARGQTASSSQNGARQLRRNRGSEEPSNPYSGNGRYSRRNVDGPTPLRKGYTNEERPSAGNSFDRLD